MGQPWLVGEAQKSLTVSGMTRPSRADHPSETQMHPPVLIQDQFQSRFKARQRVVGCFRLSLTVKAAFGALWPIAKTGVNDYIYDQTA